MTLVKPFIVYLGLFGAALAGSVLAAGCGITTTAACVPGQSIACVGNGQCADAFQVCKDDGSGYGGCQCRTGDGGNGIFPTVGPNSGLIGAACGSPINCRKGLDCVTSGASFLNGEGPSSGLCLAACRSDAESICKSYDAKSKCVVLDDAGTPADPSDDIAYCLPGCSIGNAKDPDKCRS